MSVSKYRDLTLAPVPGGTVVVAADSCASTGQKSGDTLKCPPYHCGRVSARVVLFELFCIGAEVLVIADGICSEMDPTGLEIIRGFRDEMAMAGLPENILTGSTEDNFSTCMTGVGTAAVGYLPGDFVQPAVPSGSVIACCGVPLVGMAFLHNDGSPIADYAMLKALNAAEGVYELIPVGSHGIAYESQTAAELHGLTVEFDPDCPLDLTQSGGPSTCVLTLMTEAAFKKLSKDLPLTRIGNLK